MELKIMDSKIMDSKVENQNLNVAVLIPCLNEEVTVEKVVKDFKEHLASFSPIIYVFDNNSTDKTASKAQAAGAIVIPSKRQGKGYVVQHMFNTIDADIYIMVDGDDTYPADYASKLIAELLTSGADMVVGARLVEYEKKSFRPFHNFGNRLVAWLISSLFETKVTDVLSGYRVFSKSFVKSIPFLSQGFEIETEMTLQALAKNFVLREYNVPYGRRPEGSYSKLNTFSDGVLVLWAIFTILKDYRPLFFFGIISAFCGITSLIFGIFPIMDYILYQYVTHVPLAILATGLAILSILSLFSGMILDTVKKYHNENFILFKRLLR